MISLSNNSLSVFRNPIDFHILILCPVTLPKSLISSNILVKSSGISLYEIMPSTSRHHFAFFSFSFMIQITLIYFSYPISITGTSSTMLNRSHKSNPSSLVPITRYFFSKLSAKFCRAHCYTISVTSNIYSFISTKFYLQRNRGKQ